MLTFLNFKNFYISKKIGTFANVINKHNINMETLNINKVVDQYGYSEEELARAIFPTVRFPDIAFRRVLKGETTLDANQISLLAKYLQVPISDLFVEQNTDWHATSKNGQTIFYKGPYTITLSRDRFKVTITRGQDLVNELVGAIGLMTVQDFLNKVDSMIKEFEYKVNNNK